MQTERQSKLKRNSSVPEEIDKLPEIPSKRHELVKQISKPGKEESFKKNALDVIKEDRDDDFCKYQDDFEIPEVVDIQPLNLKKNIELLLNPRSAEPHLHKSKALNL